MLTWSYYSYINISDIKPTLIAPWTVHHLVEYLNKIGREETAQCHHCPADLDSTQPSLEDCPTWAADREALVGQIGFGIGELGRSGLSLRSCYALERDRWLGSGESRSRAIHNIAISLHSWDRGRGKKISLGTGSDKARRRCMLEQPNKYIARIELLITPACEPYKSN